MARKPRRATSSGFFIEGVPASLRSVREAVREDTLRAKLGDCITARDIRQRTGIPRSTLQKWQRSGRIRALKIGSKWFYSLQDVVEVIKSGDAPST